MDDFFTSEEKKELFSLYRHLLQSAGDSISWKDCLKLKRHLIKAAQCNGLQRNNFGMNPVIRDLQTAVIVAEEIGMKGSCLIGIMLHEIVKAHILSIEEVNAEYGEDVGSIIKGLVKTNELYSKSPAIESENFRNLLLSFAEDMRVILIMIADRVNIMRQIKDTGNEEDRVKVANEAGTQAGTLQTEIGVGRLVAEIYAAGNLLLYKGEAQRDESIPRQVYRFFHRSYPEEGKGSRTEVRHQGTYQIHPFHLE